MGFRFHILKAFLFGRTSNWCGLQHFTDNDILLCEVQFVLIVRHFFFSSPVRSELTVDVVDDLVDPFLIVDSLLFGGFHVYLHAVDHESEGTAHRTGIMAELIARFDDFQLHVGYTQVVGAVIVAEGYRACAHVLRITDVIQDVAQIDVFIISVVNVVEVYVHLRLVQATNEIAQFVIVWNGASLENFQDLIVVPAMTRDVNVVNVLLHHRHHSGQVLTISGKNHFREEHTQHRHDCWKVRRSCGFSSGDGDFLQKLRLLHQKLGQIRDIITRSGPIHGVCTEVTLCATSAAHYDCEVHCAASFLPASKMDFVLGVHSYLGSGFMSVTVLPFIVLTTTRTEQSAAKYHHLLLSSCLASGSHSRCTSTQS